MGLGAAERHAPALKRKAAGRARYLDTEAEVFNDQFPLHLVRSRHKMPRFGLTKNEGLD